MNAESSLTRKSAALATASTVTMPGMGFSDSNPAGAAAGSGVLAIRFRSSGLSNSGRCAGDDRDLVLQLAHRVLPESSRLRRGPLFWLRSAYLRTASALVCLSWFMKPCMASSKPRISINEVPCAPQSK